MALWKDPSVKDPAAASDEAAGVEMSEVAPRATDRPASVALASVAAEPLRRAAPAGAAKESLIAADVTIEGKIEVAGDVRIACRF